MASLLRSSSISSSTAPDAARMQPSEQRPAGLLGLSLAGFAEVIRRAGGREVLAGRSTSWLKAHVAIPLTAAAGASCMGPCAGVSACDKPYHEHTAQHSEGCGASFAELLMSAEGGAQLASVANVFLSHAYDYAFLDAVDAAEAWASRQSEARSTFYFYFDLLVVNQHGQNGVVSFDVLRDEFGGGVRGIGNTLFLLDFKNPVSLSRAWCVFELAVSLVSKARFEVIMPPRDEAAFQDMLENNYDDLIYKTCAVDVEKARAFCPDDLTNITRMIKEEFGGFLVVNQLVVGAMGEWMASAGQAALARLKGDDRSSSQLIARLASLLRDQGKLSEAEPLYIEALEGRRLVLGNDHPNTLNSIFNLANVLQVQGKFYLAEPLYLEALEGRRRILSNDHPSTLSSINNLAALMKAQGKLSRADALYFEALEGRRRVLGNDHPDTLTSINNLANLRKAHGRLF